MRALETAATGVNITDITLSGDFTIEAWVKLDPGQPITNADGIVAGSGQDINFFAGRIRVFDGSDIVVANTATSADVWTHYAITREAGVTKIYVDGLLDATSGVNWTNSFTVETIAAANAGALEGQLDELRIWDVALSEGEIADSYDKTIDPQSAGLQRYYDFEGDSQFIVDRTGNAETEEELPAPPGTSLVDSSAPVTVPISDIAIVNPSFEANVLGDFQAVTQIDGWTLSGGGMGTWNPRADFFSDEAPDGENVAFIDNGGTISQTLAETFEAGRSYQLTVAVGDESAAGENLGWEIRLFAGTQLLGSVNNSDFNPADDSFLDAVLTLNASDLASQSASFGEPLRVEIFDAVIAGENNAQFDDVRLQSAIADRFPGSVDPSPPAGERALASDATPLDIEDITLSGDFTIEAWIYLDPAAPLSNNQGLVAGPNNDMNFFAGNFRVFDSTGPQNDIVIASTGATAGVWTHYAVTREAGVAKIYVDGVLDATSPVNWTNDFTIEQLAKSFTSALDGALDEVRIWDVARSEAEVADSYDKTVDPASGDLLRYYGFDGAGVDLVDLTGNTPDLALPAGVTFIDSTAPVSDGTAPPILSVAIANAGFEAQVLGDFQAATTIDDWTLSGPNMGVWNPRADFYSDEAPEGQNIAFIDNGGTISQSLSETFEAGRSYRLSVKVGDEATAGENLGWEVRLFAGTQLLGSVDNSDFNPADDSFIDAVLTLDGSDLAAFSASYGQSLRVELFDSVQPGENNAQFDDVRLDYVEADSFPTDGGGDPDPSSERALLANGVSVDVPDLILSGDFTIEAWVYNTPGQTVSNADGIVSGPNNDLNFFQGQFRIFDGSTAERDIAISSKTETSGDWTHYAVTREGGVAKIYVDGVLDVTSTTNWTNDFTIDKIAGTVFGETNDTGLTGQLDELQIWDVARSQAEISADMAGGIDAAAPDLLRYYDFNGDGPVLVDVTGNSADAPLPAGANFVTSTAPLDGAPPSGGDFIDTQVVDGLFLPTDMAFLPDGRMLVIEKGGLVKIVDDPTQPGSGVETYLDLTAQTQNAEEKGLLAVEVDPNFDTNGYVYFYYTQLENGQGKTTVSRFEHQENAGSSSSRGELSTETVLWQENDVTSSCCHQGGGLSIAFEPIDASDPSPYKLYIVTSDEFTPANSQDLTHPDGKVHRINLTDGSIPTDNPYYDPVAAAAYTPEIDASSAISTSAENLAIDPQGIITTIHSHGLRNGWRSSYDQESGNLFIGEVGGNNNNTSDEDIHIAVAGADYAWGPNDYPGFDGEGFLPDPNDPGNPIHSYPHLGGPGQGDSTQNGGASITGGVVYRGDQFPDEYTGAYFYGDWVRNWIRYLEIDYSGERPTLVSDNFFKNATGQVLAFEEGPDGALYYITTFQTGNVFTFEGTVNRISFEGGNSAPEGTGIALDPGEDANPTAPYTVTFEADVIDPDGDALSYLWSFGDGVDLDGDGIGDTATSTEENPSYTYTDLGQYVVELVVTDAQGATTVFDSKIITVGNTPDPVIQLPLDGGTYRAGQTITLDGFADDIEDGLIDGDDRLIWSTTFQLGDIQRPGPIDGTADQAGGVTFTTPDSGNLESALDGISVFLTATDSDGLAETTSINLTAEKAPLVFDAPVQNYTFIFDDRAEGGDFSFNSIIGFNHSVEAQETYAADGFEYSFIGWEDGETSRTRDIVTPETGQSFRPLYEVTGEVGQALALDGTDHVDVPQLVLGEGGGDFTVEAWVKFDNATIDNIDGLAGSGAFGEAGANDINFFNGQIRVYANDFAGGNDPVVAAHVSQVEVWTHYAIVREGGVMKVYVDGVLDQTTPTSWTGPFTVDHIGGTVQAGGLSGEIDEWRAWSLARSEAEILADKDSVLTVPQAGLERYYSFDGDLSDSTGNSAAASLPAAGSLVTSTAPVSGGSSGGTTISIADTDVLEGDAGSVELVFTVLRTGDLSGESSASFATANGDALAGSDYVAQSGVVSFAAGESSQEIRIVVASEEVVEIDETLTVTLSNPIGAELGRDIATGTILNDDIATPAPTVVFLLEDGVAGFDGTFDGSSATSQIIGTTPLGSLSEGGVELVVTFDDLNGNQGLASADASLFGTGGHYNLRAVGNDLELRLQDGAGDVGNSFEIRAADVLSIGEPIHVFSAFGPDGLVLYVNGLEVGRDGYTGGPLGNSEQLVLGGNNFASTSGTTDSLREPLNGEIERFALYQGQPDASEVLALADDALNITPTVVNDDTATTDEDTPISIDVLANEEGDNPNPLTLVSASDGANGTTEVVAGEVVYTPNAHFNGTDSFTYVASTVEGGEQTATVTVTVDPINDDPTAVDDGASTLLDTAVLIDVTGNDQDIDGDLLVVTSVTDGANGTVVNNNDGTVSYTPAAGFLGTDSFEYTIDDQNGGAPATATVTVNVLAAPNTPPVANDDAIIVDEDDAVTFQPGANDTDDDGDSVVATSVEAQAASGTAVVNPDGTVTYTPNANFNGDDSFTVMVGDGNGGFDTSEVSVTVTPLNDRPEANDDVASTEQDAAVIINVLANDQDIDGDVFFIDGVNDGTNGTVVDNGNGTVTYTPDAGFAGSDSFVYQISDGTLTDTATVTVNVSSFPEPVVDMPGDMVFNGLGGSVLEIAHDPIYEVPEGTVNFTFNAADTSGGQGLFTKDASGFVGGGNHFAIWLAGSTLSARFQDGVDQTVISLPGVIAGQDYDVAATFDANGVALYVDGQLIGADSLVMDWTTNREFIQWGGRGWASDSEQPGFDAPFNGIISDKQFYDLALSDTQVAELHTGAPSNSDPVAVDDSIEVSEDGSTTFDPALNDSDVDGDSVITTGVASDPGNGTAVLNADNSVTYTPDADFFGNDSFEVQVGDGNGGFDISQVNVTVSPLDDDPFAVDDAAETQEGEAVDIDLLANDIDVDGDVLSIVGLTAATNGQVVDNGDGTVTYSPDAGFIGEDSFVYTLSDGAGPTSDATVTVTVREEPTLPSAIFEMPGITSFSGSKKDVNNVPPDPSLEIEEGTVAFSFIDDDPSARQGLVTKDAFGFEGGGNHLAAYIDDGDLNVRFQDGTNSTLLSFQGVEAGREYEVAAVFGSEGAKLFVDGDLVDENSNLVMSWENNQEFLQIGGLGWGSDTGDGKFGSPFSGEMADVQIFDQALDAAQIQELAALSSFDDPLA